MASRVGLALLWHRAAAIGCLVGGGGITALSASSSAAAANAATAVRPTASALARLARAASSAAASGSGNSSSSSSRRRSGRAARRDDDAASMTAVAARHARSAATAAAAAPAPAPPTTASPTTASPLAYADLVAAADAGRRRPGSSPDPSVSAHLAAFAASPAARDAALALYVNAALFDAAAPAFARLVSDAVAGGGPVADRLKALVASEGAAAAAAAASPTAAASSSPSSPSSSPGPLFPLFASHCVAHHARAIAAYRDVVQALDMRAPHTWHPAARALTRRIIYHAGPTNSGKTHAALAALAGAASGVYCGPLRLLAVEVWDELNARGVPTRLVTGQEARDVPGAQHTACTVEMADVGHGSGAGGGGGGGAAQAGAAAVPSHRVAVAVIDEIQLIGDPGRGWAWTRALHGLAADEVHVCGDATALGLVSAIAADCGDAFEVRTYRRFRPLRLDTDGLPRGLADVRAGDCVVAFSRADIYSARAALEAATGLRAAVIYGALPPETRRAQAVRFNTPGGGADVLVASDAVGMGLNLNIRRVVFAGMTKPVGAGVAAGAAAAGAARAARAAGGGGRGKHGARAPIPASAVKQIAGRAGRRSSPWPEGLATTLDPADLPSLAAALATPTTTADTPAAALFPELDQLEAYAGRHPGAPLADVLARAAGEATLDGRYFFAQQTSVLEAAALLQAVPGLSLRDRFLFCAAPASPRDRRSGGALVAFATAYAAGGPVPLEAGGHAALVPPAGDAGGRGGAGRGTPPRGPPRRGSHRRGRGGGGGGADPARRPLITTPAAMKDAEDAHAIVSLWLWLAHRFAGSGRFPGVPAAQAEAGRIIALLDEGLDAVGDAARAAAAAAAARSGFTKRRRGRAGRAEGEDAGAAAAVAAAAP